MGRKEFVESLKRDTGYQEMYDFIVGDFATGEVITQMDVYRRFRQKYPSSRVFNNWDRKLLFDTVITSLEQEGRVHLFATGTGEYVIGSPRNITGSQEKLLE
ncbi:MAG: hypothetical protein HFJ29_07095 [Clostridia bacterium]|nr:hypothetical protein [Clostridia bacterium]